jgi:hypothetical protein
MRSFFLAALIFLSGGVSAQTNAPPAKPSSPVKLSRSAVTAAELQKTVDQLTQSNRDLLDLLKNQQAVLEDIQFDRRLQSRQIQSLEERLEESLFQNNDLQKKIATLEADAATRPATAPLVAPVVAPGLSASTNTPPPAPKAAVAPEPPPPPSTYLPAAPETETEPGTKSWHRLFTLKGEDTRQTDLFHIDGRTWRVLWHNLDKPGKAYANTSALFINAFPKDDTIPQKVCAKLGSGGDSTELDGPGNYYLKIEASGGNWELAVEDFR